MLAVVTIALSVFIMLCTAILASAGTVVILRYKRSGRGLRDLFHELNKSREPAVIAAAAVCRISRVRRWLARRLLGHDFLVGDLVEIKSWSEIRATLDEQGCLGQLPFMPEMLSMCGQRTHVFRCMHRLFDYRKTRLMRHMDGSVLLVQAVCNGLNHGGCDAACHTIWKSAWLRRIDGRSDRAVTPANPDQPGQLEDTVLLRFGTQAPRFACQLTQLNAASRPIWNWSPINFLRPLVSGNVAPLAFVVGWLTHLFNELQQARRGAGFPTFEPTVHDEVRPDDTRWAAGDQVVVKTSGAIRATLNEQSLNRGLYFEPDMLKHCGRRYCVQAEVKKLVDIVSGEMRIMKSPAYMLRDTHFSGERQLFNAQYEPLFWRGLWLRKAEDGVNGPKPALDSSTPP